MLYFHLIQLLNEVLQSLNSDPQCNGNYLLVRLDGLVHTDDHQALLDIAAQLDVEHELGENVQVSPYCVCVCVWVFGGEGGREGDQKVSQHLTEYKIFSDAIRFCYDLFAGNHEKRLASASLTS